MKKLLIVIIIIAIAGLIFNPSEKKHEEKVKKRFKDKNPLTGMFVDNIIPDALQYKSYYVASVSKLKMTDDVISVGAFGYVAVLPDLDLNELMKEAKKRIK